ncbi:MAG: hypothetical protein ACTHNQ_03815 [Microbacterium sp.]|uniref:hypothetical protein n=1 Tax=Microbacterium sp. TaxID=51671 RepID=UPI003F7FDB91
MTDEWVVDDDSIPDGDYVHRRLTEPGDLIIDQISGELTLGITAYRYANDGMSVYITQAMTAQGLTDVDLVTWEGQALARVTVATVRRADEGAEYVSRAQPGGTVAQGEERETPGGVIYSEGDHHDERLRRSHGLVRVHERPPAKRLWNAFRNKLLQNTEVKRARNAAWQDPALRA